MNTWQFADDFLAQFEADATFATSSCRNAQDAADFEAPALVFGVKWEPFSADGLAGRFTLGVDVHSLSAKQDEGDSNPDVAHAARVLAVRAALLGDGKAALRAAIEATGRWQIAGGPGWSAAPEQPGVEGHRFLTPVIIAGTVVCSP